MNFTRTSLVAVVLVAGMFGGVPVASSSDDTLVRAKSLYAAAAYDEALASISDRGQLLRECRLRVERLRVLVKLERSLEDDLELARASAHKLRFPEKMLSEIDKIEAGE